MRMASFGSSLVSHQPKPSALGQSSTAKILHPGSINTSTDKDRMPTMTYHGIPNLLGSGFNVSLMGSSCFSPDINQEIQTCGGNKSAPDTVVPVRVLTMTNANPASKAPTNPPPIIASPRGRLVARVRPPKIINPTKPMPANATTSLRIVVPSVVKLLVEPE